MRPGLFAALVAVGLVLAASARAGDGLSFSPAVIEACLERGEGRACVGASVDPCTETSPAGGSTIGIAACIEAERAWWDDQLNAAYRQRLALARQIDAEAPVPGMRQRRSDVEALRVMQRAWIVFRDATCAFEGNQWWGGTGMSGAISACLMRLTGEQTLYLRRELGF